MQFSHFLLGMPLAIFAEAAEFLGIDFAPPVPRSMIRNKSIERRGGAGLDAPRGVLRY